MGEIADAMLDGTLCCVCGVYIGREDADNPQMCGACEDDESMGNAPQEGD